MSRYSDWGWPAYVPVAERRRKAIQKMEQLRKKGQTITPVKLSGRTIAETFWGKAWCRNLEAYSDYANRLPRGRTYVRNGSVVDLQIGTARVTAMVSGTHLYQVEIGIRPLNPPAWKRIRSACMGKISSLLDLLRGRLSRDIMEIVTRPQTGLFPTPAEISFKCSCPDWASMCKHVAATLYGVGARLDHEPELFFRLRDVDHRGLISIPEAADLVITGVAKEKIIAEDDLAGIFGIELDSGAALGRKASAKPEKQKPGRKATPKAAPPVTTPEKPKRGRPVSKPKQAAAAEQAPPAPALREKPGRGRVPLLKKAPPEPEKTKRGRKPSLKAAPPAATVEKPRRGRKPAPVIVPVPAPVKKRGRPPGRKKQ